MSEQALNNFLLITIATKTNTFTSLITQFKRIVTIMGFMRKGTNYPFPTWMPP